ncbi:predicted membrane protein [Longilinea arvoryzae]|uniref:Predicted membrane protein n=2 Tax=Longilinea arvoryzae TaxID=360412 RepID=A0A0S7BGR6_9CHLR|nr:predicted membrane protein [Longilinea arvoryzae]
MISVSLYSIAGETDLTEVRAMLQNLQETHPHEVIEIDLEQNPLMRDRIGKPLPVLECGPYHLRWPFTEQDLRVLLSAATQRREYYEKTGDKGFRERVDRGRRISGMDRFVLWLSRHFMLVFNLIVFLYVGLPFLAPVFEKAGDVGPAKVIYAIYSPLCHQLAFRSFFLFGEQPFYPLERAHVAGFATYEQVIGADKANIIDGRNFIGNDLVGYKVALCERDVAIYSGFLIFGLIYALSNRKWKPLHWAIWIIIGILPIGWDGISQLPGLAFTPPAWMIIRESTPLLRSITGLLFGITTAWFLYPYVAESMAETRELILRKLQYVQQLTVKG